MLVVNKMPLIHNCLLFCGIYGFITFYDVKANGIEGYYWRDYKGILPKDALPGGQEKGKTTYIGLVLHKELLVPATIVPGEKKAYYEWGFKALETRANVQILCTNHPDHFQWIKATKNDFTDGLKGYNIVEAGYEPNAKLYIGRTYVQGEVVLGKLLVNDAAVLHSPKDGKGEFYYIYEVLVYHPPSNADSTNNEEQKPIMGTSRRCTIVNLYC